MSKQKDPESDGSVGIMTDTASPLTGSPEEYDLERLGRERPPIFSSWIQEFMFACSLLISMLMAVCLNPYF